MRALVTARIVRTLFPTLTYSHTCFNCLGLLPRPPVQTLNAEQHIAIAPLCFLCCVYARALPHRPAGYPDAPATRTGDRSPPCMETAIASDVHPSTRISLCTAIPTTKLLSCADVIPFLTCVSRTCMHGDPAGPLPEVIVWRQVC